MRKPGNQRALKVIRSLRARHQKQMQQIDILCNDMVGVHRHFAVKLAGMMHAARFYETLLSCSSLADILNAAFEDLCESIASCSAVFVLPEENAFEVHRPGGLAADELNTQFQNWFSRQLVIDISLSPRVCSMNKMLQMGLQGPPSVLKTISAAAIPLSRYRQAVGFILVYRSGDFPLTAVELSNASSVSAGLSRAIQVLQNGVKQSL